jgi:hypothetical protein
MAAFRLAPEHAAKFFALVQQARAIQDTRIVINH